MLWLTLSILSYFINAVVVVVDKVLVSAKSKSPFVYAFYVGLLNCFAILLWPVDFAFLSERDFLLALFAGASFFFAIFFFYSSMLRGSISRSVSIIGGISPLILLFLSYFILGERLPAFWLVAVILLAVGSFLLSSGRSAFTLYTFLAALFFALSFFASKVIYMENSFLNAFIWTRLGVIFPALMMLFARTFRDTLFGNPLKISSSPLFVLFTLNKVFGASAFLLINISIMLGPVAVVNALQGVEYVSVFVLAFILSIIKPHLLEEFFGGAVVKRKLGGIGLVCLGLILLFI